ncbi:MAG: hypothetical protein JRD19_05600 [Deltaproteobacteria bacterium]|nr:hypothetical protein [Deltaproteobacteria bacterium]
MNCEKFCNLSKFAILKGKLDFVGDELKRPAAGREEPPEVGMLIYQMRSPSPQQAARNAFAVHAQVQEGGAKKFNGEAALLFRACFHIEGDWRPFEDGILWENEGAASPVETFINIIPFIVLCNITY